MPDFFIENSDISMEILRNTPGSHQNSLKLTLLLADPGATLLREVCRAHRKLLHRSEFARERTSGYCAAQKNRTLTIGRSSTDIAKTKRSKDGSCCIALSETQDAAVSWNPRSARKKEELDKPANTLSDVIQLQNCSTHSSTGF